MDIIAFIIYLATIGWCLARSTFQDCDRKLTYGYDYSEFYSLKKLQRKDYHDPTVIFYFEFYVKAASDAHILLFEEDDISTNRFSFSGAYEIVIGGGKNSFSQIRLYRKDTKSTQFTENIMSSVEYKEFWIKLTTHHIIMVGKKGESEPFLFWVNPSPFQVNYVAFSTWNNVKGEWYFNCQGYSNLDPEQIVGERNVTAIQRLKNDLLTFYNPSVIPQRDDYPDETIEVHFEANYFRLDEKHGRLSLNGMAVVKWIDWKLSWNPADYEGIENIFVSPYLIWTPGIQVLNSLAFEKKYLLSLSGSAVVSSKGRVVWRVPFHSETLCVLGYNNWPFDMHNCSLVFGFWTEPLKINISGLSLTRISESEWEIQKINGKDLVISHIDDFGGIIDISFRRRDPSYEFLLLPPFMGASALVLVSFWLHPTSSMKIFLRCGSVIILILILTTIASCAPSVSAATPKLVRIYSWSVVIMSAPIILLIGLRYIPPYIRAPRILSSLLNSRVLDTVLFLPVNPEQYQSCTHLREQEVFSVSAGRLVTIIERFVFLIYLILFIITFLNLLTQFRIFSV